MQLDAEERVTTIRVLVIGKTGNGKSSVCNAFWGRRVFETGCSMSSTTLQMQCAETNRDGVHYKVVDTPDVTNSDMTESEIKQEVSKWKTETSPYPSVVLLTVRCDVKYTAEEHGVYRDFLTLWEDYSVKSKLVVAFTFGDRQDGDIKEELETGRPELQNVLRDAGGRYVVYNDMAHDLEKDDFVKNVEELVTRMEQKIVLPQRATTIRVLVIGKTGNGKSSVCNALLGRREFETGRSMSSTTLQIQYADTNRDGIHYKVVDTPDVTNSEMTESEIKHEVSTWKTETSPYPSVVLLAVRCDVRYTAEEYAVYREFLRLWGENSVKSKLAVAFTFGDRQDGDIEEALKTVCPELQNVLSDAGGRYVVFNDMADDLQKDDFVRSVGELVTGTERKTTQPRPLVETQKLDHIYLILLILLWLDTFCVILLQYAFALGRAALAIGVIGIVLVFGLAATFVKIIYFSPQRGSNRRNFVV